MHDFIENEEKFCKYKWVNSSVSVFLILYVDKFFLIGMTFFTLQRIKVLLLSLLSIKYLRKISLILGMKIYKDRSKRPLGLSQSTYIECL